jgi:hypothetical protein
VKTEAVYVISNDTYKTERMKGFFNDFPVHWLCLISYYNKTQNKNVLNLSKDIVNGVKL